MHGVCGRETGLRMEKESLSDVGRNAETERGVEH